MATKEWKQKNKDKINAYRREWYKKNQESEVKRLKESNDRRLRHMIEWFQEYKSTLECEKCGFSQHPAAIDFHHRNPEEKEMKVADTVRTGWSKERILKEIEKCDVLCANCHRIEHWNIR